MGGGIMQLVLSNNHVTDQQIIIRPWTKDLVDFCKAHPAASIICLLMLLFHVVMFVIIIYSLWFKSECD